MEILIHAANVLFLASFLVKDILWLRVLSVFGGAFLMAFQLLAPAPIWAAVGWNVVFSVINVVQIRRLLAERRPVALTEDEHRVHQLAFRALSPRELRKLLAIGAWKTIAADERLVTHGAPLDRLMVVVDGRVRVSHEGRTICDLAEGQFVGEMSFLTGEPPRADVDVVEEGRVVAWPKEALSRFLSESPELRAAFQTRLGADLVGKIGR
jgi:hypothetical protein